MLADSFFGVRCGRVRFILNFAAPGQRLISIDPKDIPQGALKSLSKIRPKSTLVRIVCAYLIGSDEDSIVGRLKGVGVLREVILGTGRTGAYGFSLDSTVYRDGFVNIVMSISSFSDWTAWMKCSYVKGLGSMFSWY